jgi:hypothetical protein
MHFAQLQGNALYPLPGNHLMDGALVWKNPTGKFPKDLERQFQYQRGGGSSLISIFCSSLSKS